MNTYTHFKIDTETKMLFCGQIDFAKNILSAFYEIDEKRYEVAEMWVHLKNFHLQKMEGINDYNEKIIYLNRVISQMEVIKYNHFDEFYTTLRLPIDLCKAIKADIEMVIEGLHSRKKDIERCLNEQFANPTSRQDNVMPTVSEYWKNLIKPEYHEWIDKVEEKIKSKVSDWRGGKDKIGCAAFCQLLFDKKYFEPQCTIRKSVNSFARSRYAIDLTVQLTTKEDTKRNKNKARFEHAFR